MRIFSRRITFQKPVTVCALSAERTATAAAMRWHPMICGAYTNTRSTPHRTPHIYLYYDCISMCALCCARFWCNEKNRTADGRCNGAAYNQKEQYMYIYRCFASISMYTYIYMYTRCMYHMYT